MLALARHTAQSLTGVLLLAPLLQAAPFQHEEDDCLDAIGYAAGALASKTTVRSTVPRPEILGLGVCTVDNARTNTGAPIKTNADFVPIYGDDSLGFYCIYGVKASSTGGVGGNVTISLFELANGEVLVFGSGYGNIPGANLFDAAYDMERVDQVIQHCMGKTPATTPLRLVAPHGHGDHINPACNRELERLGYTILEITFHQDDLTLMNGMGWTTADRAKFNMLPRATTCLQELDSFASPLGKIWFFERPGHTAGSIDLVIDVKNDPSNRFVVRGSQANSPCAPLAGQREIVNAHGNMVLVSTPPALTGLDTFTGTSLGGTPVTLTGTDFLALGAGTPEVRFAGVRASNVVVVNGTTLTCLSPTGPPGQLVDVTVVNNNGQSNLASAFFYNPLPAVSGITPTSGDWHGNTIIQVRGSGFLGGGTTEVWFGTKKSPSVSVKGDTLLTCRTPAGTPGTTVDVFARNLNGEGRLALAYTYAADLSLSDAEPDHATALGGTEILLSGTAFGTSTPSVTFGGIAATSVTLLGTTSLRCTTPAGTPGTTVDVVITTGSGSSALPGFRYHAAPSLGSILPAASLESGGATVTLTGSGFLSDAPGANVVRLGGTVASNVVVLSDTSLTCVVPPGAGGTTVNVTIANQNGTATLPLSFSYTRTLAVNSLVPVSASAAGGAVVTFQGAGFLDGPAGPTSVLFGTKLAQAVNVLDDSTLTATAPAGTPGSVVTLSLQNANGAVTLPNAFRYHAAPTLASVSPDHGHAGSNTPVTLTGTGFLNDTASFALVVAGGIAASNVTVLSDTQLTCQIPPGTPGARVDLVLATQNGSATLVQGFRYHTAPTLAALAPASGAGNNAQRVTLTGTGYQSDAAGVPTVRVGGVLATSVAVVDDATVRCNVPTGKFGASVDVVLTNARGSATLVNGYRYHARPNLSGIAPNRGSFQGNTLVTLSGTGFTVDQAGATTVSIGGVSATAVTVLSDGSLTCRTPPGVRDTTVDVVLTNANGVATLSSAFSYSVPAPTVLALTPASGPAQAPGSVQITGSGFTANAAGANTVLFGAQSSGIVGVIDDTTLTCQVPPGTPGARVDVIVSNTNGIGTLALGFRYHALPSLASVTPASAGAQGGALVELTGSGFLVDAPGTNTVTFAGIGASAVSVLSDSRLTCVVPAGTPGANVLVRVSNANGASGTTSFAYNTAPTLGLVTPNTGPALGGTQVVLTGSGFLGANAGANLVTVGGRTAGNVTVLSDTTIACETPRGTGGFAEVRLSNSNGTAVLPNGFHYGKLPPEISSFTPATGPAGGQNVVTLKGRGFASSGAGANRVKFGALFSANVITIDDETVLCTVPAGSPGSDVVVALNNNSGTASAATTYHYRSVPTLLAVDPPEGPALGQGRVTLLGSGFLNDGAGPASVYFDNVRARDVVVQDDQHITCPVVGGSPGTVLDVTVRNDNGSATLVDAYRVTGGPPAVADIDPGVGPYTGGTPITVVGAGFTGTNPRVYFGVERATNVLVLDDTTLTCRTPAGTLDQRVTVSVQTKNGSAALLNAFLYTSLAPALESLAPDNGPPAGGTPITLTGAGFQAVGVGATTVTFGANAATSVVVLDDTHVSCLAPAGAAGASVDVALTNGNGTSVLRAAYRYHRAPVVTQITPTSGVAGGGTSVTLTGQGFLKDGAGTNVVRFGANLATNVVVLGDTSLTCTAPAGTPNTNVDVRVSNANGAATLPAAFHYRTVPVLTALAPTRGPSTGGTSLTLTGSGFASDTAGVNVVRLGGALALSVVTVNDTTITCVTPSGVAGTDVDVRVTNDNGTSVRPAAFRYFAAPTLTSLAPGSGPAEGGTTVTLRGAGFLDPEAGFNLVLFGGISALDVVELSDTELTCTTPPGASGARVDVLLVNANGSAQLASAFRYFVAPTLTGLGPNHGPAAGGTTVTLNGSGFLEPGAGTPAILFGSAAASVVNVLSDVQVRCVAPPGTADARVAVTLTNTNGSANLPAAYRYHALPTLTSVTPGSGSASGGTSLTLRGTGFLADAAGLNLVRIGGLPATGVSVVSDTELTAVSAGGPADLQLDVALQNDNGTATLAGAFRYVTAPTLTAVSPGRGPAAGGNAVVVSGTGFLAPGAGTNLVLFGGVAALDVLELDDSSIACTVPEGLPGTTVDLLVVNANGTGTLTAGYRYHASPTLSALTPDHGPAGGGSSVTLTGSGFERDDAGLTVILFGATKASQVNVLDDTRVSCRVPAGTPATSVDVRVTNANGSAALLAAWRYHAEPTITAVAPGRGPAAGGTAVTVTGTGFVADGAGPATVVIGGMVVADAVVVSDTTLTFVTPDGHPNAQVDVIVSNANGNATRTSGFRYNALPTLTGLAPASGPEAGGNSVTLTGSGFANFGPGANLVTFGGVAASGVSVLNDTTLTCLAPAGAGGTRVDVALTNANGSDLRVQGYRYNPAPRLTTVLPTSASSLGGLSVLLNGSGFADPSVTSTLVTFGGIAAFNLVVLDDSRIQCELPAGAPGTLVDVLVFNDNGQAQLPAGFRYHARPSLSAVSPGFGSSTTSSLLSVSGSGFLVDGAGPNSVLFGTVAATNVVVVNDTTLTCQIAPAPSGTIVDVVVSNTNGSATLVGGFSFDAPDPTLVQLSPTSGAASGGTVVTLDGTGFLDFGAGPNSVTFGGVPATGVSVQSDTKLTCTTPAGALGALVDVSLTNLNGTDTLVGAFTYTAPLPLLTAVTPPSGVAVGGGSVTLSGSGFQLFGAGTTTVTFGGVPATSVSVQNDSTLTCTVPAGTGGTSVTVALTNANGSTQLAAGYRYHALPQISSLLPVSGTSLGGTLVTISGAGFLNDAPGTNTVRFGTTLGTSVSVLSDTQLRVRAPSGTPGAIVNVSVANANGTATLPSAFRYHLRPTLTVLAPASGPAAGGTRVTLTGSGFTADGASVNVVSFGGVVASGTTVLNNTTIECNVPAGTSGLTVQVTVANVNGTALLANGYRFHARPTLTSVTPPNGPAAGGTSVTVVGSGFQVDSPGTNALTFGGQPAGAVVVVNDTQLTCLTPPGTAGTTVDVVLTNANGSGTLFGGFAYDAATLPLVSGASPGKGSTRGSTPVVLTGSGFVPNMTVSFGGVAATSVEVRDDGHLSCLTPAGSEGWSDVTLTAEAGSTSYPLGFQFVRPPVLEALEPPVAPPEGGTLVVLRGSGFRAEGASEPVVHFGAQAALGVTVLDDTHLACEVPAGVALDEADVCVTNDIDQALVARAFRWQHTLRTDLDRDGRGDVLIGASGLDSVHVFHGRALPMGPRTTADSDVRATGAVQGSGFGAPVTAGDVDGDGFSDLIVGAPREGAGAVYLFRGPLTVAAPALSALDAELVLRGEAGSDFGRALCLDDANRDGYLDLLVSSGGAFAQAFLYLGGPSGLAPSPALVLSSPQGDDDFGAALALGDLDGDGWPELVVGAPAARPSAREERVGLVHVYRGSAELGGESSPWLTLAGSEAGAHFGAALALGDLGGDASEELAVGAPATSSGAGAVFLYNGEPEFGASAPSVRLSSEGPSDGLGAALDLGDVDGDGRADLLVGAPGWNGLGRAYLFRGANPLADRNASSAEARLMAPLDSAGRFASAVALVDVDGNGREDLVITAPGEGEAPGQVYIFASERTLQSPHVQQADGVLSGRSPGERIGGGKIDR